jgi:ubiquitin-conjugating enzyme E2 Q
MSESAYIRNVSVVDESEAANLAALESSTTDNARASPPSSNHSPSMIPDDEVVNVVDVLPNNETGDQADEGEGDDESDYSYTYEDDDEGQYSGFLIPTETAAPTVVEPEATPAATSASVPAEESPKEDRKQKWVEPTREAVTMSLRAERETSGGRRRLAADLYKIMSSSTEAAGFTLAPAEEDSMEKWSIKLFGFDEDSNLAKDLMVVGLECVELEMTFPEQYPFEPPFVRVVSPRFQRQTGFVMNGALCMELLTKDGWNPINDIESVIVSIRSLMVVGDGRVKAAIEMGPAKYEEALKRGMARLKADDGSVGKRKRSDSEEGEKKPKEKVSKASVGSYSAAEASSAYDHLSKFHQEKGWDKSGWWAKRG